EAERLASIGQLSAGMAHEVNNPLGGMLAAIENRRLRGNLDETTQNTLALLERGLRQIHESVQALLNEARREQRLLAPEDVHDLELLLKPEADHLRCRLDWCVEAPAGCNLPAVAVRQIVLNLALNALHAAGVNGAVRIWSERHGSEWHIGVANTGLRLDENRLAKQCQGPESHDGGRRGLGLWITSRLLRTLGGRLELRQPVPPWQTELLAILPAPPAAQPTELDRQHPEHSAAAPHTEIVHRPRHDHNST
ncbi:MAG: sensor histidine kinase, partial [Casimicrobiaceae bacterium]